MLVAGLRGGTMQMPASRVRPGDQVDGADVLWVLPVPYNDTAVIALSTGPPAEASAEAAAEAAAEATDGAPGTTVRLHRYRADELVEVDAGPVADAPHLLAMHRPPPSADVGE
jgi:hypothetical protein